VLATAPGHRGNLQRRKVSPTCPGRSFSFRSGPREPPPDVPGIHGRAFHTNARFFMRRRFFLACGSPVPLFWSAAVPCRFGFLECGTPVPLSLTPRQTGYSARSRRLGRSQAGVAGACMRSAGRGGAGPPWRRRRRSGTPAAPRRGRRLASVRSDPAACAAAHSSPARATPSGEPQARRGRGASRGAATAR